MSRCIKKPNRHISVIATAVSGVSSDDLEHYRRLKSVSLKTNRSERSDPRGQISSRQTDTYRQIARGNTTPRSLELYVHAP